MVNDEKEDTYPALRTRGSGKDRAVDRPQTIPVLPRPA